VRPAGCGMRSVENPKRRETRGQNNARLGAKRASSLELQPPDQSCSFDTRSYQRRIVKMDVDEDDDFYAPEESTEESGGQQQKVEEATESNNQAEQEDEDLEEGEEEDEADSDDSVCSNAGSRRTLAYHNYRT
jgi:hypothetical protein